MQGYPAEMPVLVKRKKVGDGLAVPIRVQGIEVNWLSGATCKMISDVERKYWRYRGMTDGDKVLPIDVSAGVVDDIDA